MKDEEEIYFIKSILKDLDIQTNSVKFNKCNGAYELTITGFQNMNKFKDINGFGRNKKRANLLDKSLSTYGKIPFCIRFEQIRRILVDKEEITNKELAGLLNCHPHYIRLITKMFSKQCLLNVDTNNKVYKYSLIIN